MLRKAFADAVRNDQVLTSNPRSGPSAPEGALCGGRHVDSEDLVSFLTTTQGHRLHAFSRLAAYTDACRAELMNLRWADVHLGDEHGQGPDVRLRGDDLGHRRGEG